MWDQSFDDSSGGGSGGLAWEASDCHQHGYAVAGIPDKWISRQTVWIRVTVERLLKDGSFLYNIFFSTLIRSSVQTQGTVPIALRDLSFSHQQSPEQLTRHLQLFDIGRGKKIVKRFSQSLQICLLMHDARSEEDPIVPPLKLQQSAREPVMRDFPHLVPQIPSTCS